MSRRVIVDANIAFRALASSRGDLRSRLNAADTIRFIAPRFLFVELFKHKDRLLRAVGIASLSIPRPKAKCIRWENADHCLTTHPTARTHVTHPKAT